jgi:hypothetical protein
MQLFDIRFVFRGKSSFVAVPSSEIEHTIEIIEDDDDFTVTSFAPVRG